MKKMCKITKDGNLSKNSDYLSQVCNPRHYCDRCGRVARTKKALCKPEKLERLEE